MAINQQALQARLVTAYQEMATAAGTVPLGDEVIAQKVAEAIALSDSADAGSGLPGDDGWTPQHRLISDNDRRVLEIYNWVGGSGAAPDTGFIGMSGLTQTIAEGVDLAAVRPEAVQTVINSTVTRAFVEALGITGGGTPITDARIQQAITATYINGLVSLPSYYEEQDPRSSVYTTDDAGNLTSEVHTYADGTTESWTYTYNAQDIAISEAHVARDGSMQNYTVQSDSDGNLTGRMAAA